MQMLKPTLRVVLILGGSVLYIGVAVLAGGGPAAFFSHSALIALIVVLCAIIVASVFAGGNLSTGVKEDRDNRWVLGVFGVIGLLQLWLPPWTDRRDILCVDGETIRWVGVVLFAAGGALRLWPVVVLGDRFSGLVAIQPGHTLVTSGIYRTIRNPSYLGLLINALGWSLAFRSVVGVILTAAYLPPLIARMASEERLLHSQFGAEYDAYRTRTDRLVPWLY
jgi:protein-S-isoprenylcysteine O-methyltransferase Ste14